ncbi:MAG: ABC transporter permease [Candidatus Saccharibacteria bacterium]|nr:ABC transporter permease [Candidatus Saccharibacteria bacterium]
MTRRDGILLLELVKTDFKLRYQGSVLGYMWAIIRPLLMFGILYLVFSVFLRFGSDIPHYPVYLLVGTVLWNFFTECTNQGIQSLIQRGDLLRKLSFPKWIVVVSATSTALINLSINLIVVVIFALISGCSVSLLWLLVLPLVAELYFLALGIAFLLGSINVRYRDISSIWEVLTQALFYAVPIIYPLSMVTSTSMVAAKVLMVNPIAQILQDVREVLITDASTTSWELLGVAGLVPVALVVVVFMIGLLVFKHKSRYFAEEL